MGWMIAALLMASSVRAGGFTLPNSLAELFGGGPEAVPPPSDEERGMTDRIWRFVFAPEVRGWFTTRTPTEARAGLLTGRSGPMVIDLYYDWLRRTAYASSGVRYATITDDIDADLATIPDTFTAICRVEEIDRERRTALKNLQLGPDSSAAAAARRAENEREVGWFVASLRYRSDAYGYALDHLLVDAPDPKAKGVDAGLARLDAQVAAAERHRFCVSTAAVGTLPRPSGPEIPSRFVHGNPATVPGRPPGS